MTRQLSILRFVTCKIYEFLCLFTNNQNQFFSVTSVVAVFLLASACFLGDFVTKALAHIFALIFGIFHVSPAMVFTLEQREFMMEAYIRNRIKVDGVWTYSVQAARYDYLEQFPNDFVENKNFQETLQRCLQLFRETGSAASKSGSIYGGSGRPSSARTPENIGRVREVIENQPKTSVRHLSQQVGLCLGTCHTI